MSRLAQLILTGVISAELAGWLLVGAMYQLFSVSLSSPSGALMIVGVLAAVGAGTGALVWVLTRQRLKTSTST